MDQNILSDKDQFPTDEIIFSHIGQSRKYWEVLFSHVHNEHPDFSEQWRFYNDGKRWLLKVIRKSKTIFWLSVIEDSFIITFYFGDKAESVIMESSISDELKDSFKNGKRFGKIRGITVEIGSQSDIENIISLIAIKLSIK